MVDPVVAESWHLPRALSDEALRLLTTLPMEEIERRLRVPDLLTRAADLLERQAAAAPVARLPEDAQVIEPANRIILAPVPTPIPVSERLPGPEDFDDDGNCWWYSFLEYAWTFANLKYAKRMRFRCWLPAHALPLPEVE